MKVDAHLKQGIDDECKRDSVHAEYIAVEDGVVTLAGRVNSYSEKLDAERAVQRAPGDRALGRNGSTCLILVEKI